MARYYHTSGGGWVSRRVTQARVDARRRSANKAGHAGRWSSRGGRPLGPSPGRGLHLPAPPARPPRPPRPARPPAGLAGRRESVPSKHWREPRRLRDGGGAVRAGGREGGGAAATAAGRGHGRAQAPSDDQPVRAGGRLRRRPGQAAAAGGTLAVRGEAAPGSSGRPRVPAVPRVGAARGRGGGREESAVPRRRVGPALLEGRGSRPAPARGTAVTHVRGPPRVRAGPVAEPRGGRRPRMSVERSACRCRPSPLRDAGSAAGASVLRSRRGKARGVRQHRHAALLLGRSSPFPVQPRQLAGLELRGLALVAPLQLKRLLCAAEGLRRGAQREARPCPPVGPGRGRQRVGTPTCWHPKPGCAQPRRSHAGRTGPSERCRVLCSSVTQPRALFTDAAYRWSPVSRRIGSPRPAAFKDG